MWPRKKARKPTEQTAACGGRSCDPPSCSAPAAASSYVSWGYSTRHRSLATASRSSCVTPSVIGSTSLGRPFSLPRHMALAGWRKPGMPRIGVNKFHAWQNSANQRSSTLVTNTVTNPDPGHGTGLTYQLQPTLYEHEMQLK